MQAVVMMGSSWLLDVALVIVLIGGFGGAAVLAIVEVSLLRVRPSRVRVEAGQGNERAKVLLGLLGDMPLVLNTVLFVVLLCQVAVAAISGFLAQRWFGGIWVSLASVVVSLLLFVYAESLPKTLAVRAPHERALRSARGLRLLVRVCRPVVATLVAIAARHAPEQATPTDVVSERELRLLARQSARAGAIDIDDAELVERSFHFGDQRVADVMVDRTQLVTVNDDADVGDALQTAIDAGHQRLPVIGQDLDDVLGIVRLRDLAAAVETGSSVVDVLRRPLFVSPTEPIAQLIDEMRSAATWLAIVRDDGFRTVGLITVEDIVAELVGEIEEEPPQTGS